MPNRSLQKRFLFSLIPLLMASIIFIGCVTLLLSRHSLNRYAYAAMQTRVDQIAANINDSLNNVLVRTISITAAAPFKRFLANRYFEKGIYDRPTDWISVYDSLMTLYNDHLPLVESVYIYSDYGTEMSLIKTQNYRTLGLDADAWYREYITDSRKYLWIDRHIDTVFSTPYARDSVSLAYVQGTPEGKDLGIVLVNLAVSAISDQLDAVEISGDGYLLLLTDSEEILSERAQQEDDQIIRQIAGGVRSGTSGSNEVLSIRTQRGIFLYACRVLDNGWRVAACMPQSAVLSDLRYAIPLSAVVCLCVILFCGFVVNSVVHSFTDPVSEMALCVSQLDGGKDVVSFEQTGIQEIDALSLALSDLTQQTHELIIKIELEQKLKQREEIRSLTEQIKPHFLYNTLASARHLIDMGKQQQTSKMLLALVQFYSIGLSNGQALIALREELAHVKSYLEIMAMRYPDAFDFEVNVDEDVLSGEVCKMMLQPLIENAIYHGNRGDGSLLSIIVTGTLLNGKISLDVFDDGKGMTEEKTAELNRICEDRELRASGRCFGIRNVSNRLRLYFGAEVSFKIESQYNEYTLVHIEIPFSTHETM